MKKEDVIITVKKYIASHAKMNYEDLKDNHVLKKQPLYFDDVNLKFLAMSLRGYARSIKPDATILARDLKKGDMDVKKTYELVLKRIGL